MFRLKFLQLFSKHYLPVENTTMNITKILFLTLAATLLISCGSNQSITLNVNERQLSFPSGYYNHIIYIDDRVIGFAQDTDAPKEKQISFAYEGDEEKTLFNPEDDPNCKRYTSFQVASLLPDGRLGLFKECKKDFELTATRAIF